MKNVEAVLAVKFKSTHAPAKLARVCAVDLNTFREVPGLLQKYYLIEELTNSICGLYIFETKSARAAFWTSELAKDLPSRYGIISETLRAEQYEIALVLNEPVEDTTDC